MSSIHRIGSGRLLEAGAAIGQFTRPDGAPIDALPDDGEMYHPAHTERVPPRIHGALSTDDGVRVVTDADLARAYDNGMRAGIATACILGFVITVGLLALQQVGTELWRWLP